MHRRWLNSLRWTDRREQVVFQEYLHHLDEIEGRLNRLDAAIHQEATGKYLLYQPDVSDTVIDSE